MLRSRIRILFFVCIVECLPVPFSIYHFDVGVEFTIEQDKTNLELKERSCDVHAQLGVLELFVQE